MPAAVAIPAVLGAVGIGGSLFSGISGANAADKASQIQQKAAQQAGADVTKSAADINPSILAAASSAGAGVTKAAGDAGAGVANAADRANGLLDPYRVTGNEADSSLRTGLEAGGDFNRTPTAADIQMDPGFANRLKYGQIALERSAAARGGAASGTALMDLTHYAQSEASNEYQNAFNRFETSTQHRFDNLNTVAQRGSVDATTEGNNLIDSGKYSGDKIFDASKYSGDKTYNSAVNVGDRTFDASKLSADYLTQGANAQAGGVVGKANAITGAVNGGINSITNAGLLYSRLKKAA